MWGLLGCLVIEIVDFEGMFRVSELKSKVVTTLKATYSILPITMGNSVIRFYIG